MRKIGVIVAMLATAVLVLFGAGAAQAATNGAHSTSFNMTVGGTTFVSTVYYHNTGIGTSAPNHMALDEFAWYTTGPAADLDRISIYGDIHGDNTYPKYIGAIDYGSGQNDVPSNGDLLAYHYVGGSGSFQNTYFDEYDINGVPGVDFDNGTNLWFEVCVTGGVGSSGDHVCVKHPSN